LAFFTEKKSSEMLGIILITETLGTGITLFAEMLGITLIELLELFNVK
jgi:hypothetical protein